MNEERHRPPFWQSIAFRIQSWHALALALALAGMMVGFYRIEREHRIDTVDVELATLMRRLLRVVEPRPAPPPEDDFGPPPPLFEAHGPPGLPRDAEASPDEIAPSFGKSDWFIAWDRHGEIIGQNGKKRPEEVRWDGGKIDLPYRTLGDQRAMFFRGPHRSLIVAGMSLDAVNRDLRRYAVKLSVIGAGLFCLGVFLGWFITRWGLSPVRHMAADAARIAGGERAHRIDTHACARELYELGAVLNRSFDALEQEILRREQFTADASHELRTPMSVVLGQLQRLLAKPRSETETHEIASMAYGAATRMRNLIEQMMSLARLDEAACPVFDELDLGLLASRAAEELKGKLASRELIFRSDIAPAMAHGDEEQLHRVLVNLLTNAAIHAPHGSTIVLSTGCDAQGPWARVVDDGPAISPEHLAHLFERFYQVDGARSGGGSGLGLAICRKIAARHGGSLTVESSEGQGNAFTLRLPMVG